MLTTRIALDQCMWPTPLSRQGKRQELASFRAGEGDVLGALPEHHATHLAELVASFDDGEEVVAGELANLAGEATGAVGEEDLGLAEAAGVEEDLAGGGLGGVG